MFRQFIASPYFSFGVEDLVFMMNKLVQVLQLLLELNLEDIKVLIVMLKQE